MKKSLRSLALILFLCSLAEMSFAQSNAVKKLRISGYQKEMITFTNPNDLDLALLDFLLHNRTFIRYYPVKGLKFRADLRTRIFMGDTQKFYNALPIPGLPETYGQLVELQSEDYFKLSWTLVDKNSFILHTTLDRLYLEYANDHFEVAAGRQRINWGVNTVWNPNDLFNVYNYTDFDYEERPGSDAFRFNYYLNYTSNIEVAIKAFDTWDEAVFAGIYQFNKWNYDWQVLGGWMEGDYVLGTGWAGNISNSGLKGELSYFFNPETEDDNAVVVSASYDHAFKSSLYFLFSALYNQNGNNDSNVGEIFIGEINAKNLYPYQWALLTNFAYTVSPLFQVALAVIYSPVPSHPLYLSPVLTYSVATNWDLDFVSQIVFEKDEKYSSPGQFFFLRLKFSY